MSTVTPTKTRPEDLQIWRDEGYFLKIDGHDIFVHASGTPMEEGHGVLITHTGAFGATHLLRAAIRGPFGAPIFCLHSCHSGGPTLNEGWVAPRSGAPRSGM